MPSRRVSLASLAVFSCVAAVRVATTLRAAAAPHGVSMGTAINVAGITTEAIYKSVFETQYDRATAENECKFVSTEPQKGAFSFEQCDSLQTETVDAANGTFRLHNLCWGEQLPAWVTGLRTAADLTAALTDHVNGMIAHYGKVSTTVDVVNEAISDGGAGQPLYKTNTWYPTLATYVADAFRLADAARKAAGSSIQLAYNEYGAEEFGSAKAQRVIAMLTDFKTAGVPIDVIGLQCHFSTDSFPNVTDIQRNIRFLGATFGVKVHITELDIDVPNPTPAKLETQGQQYAALLQACVDEPACESFTSWGFTDKHTWRGEQNAPLPFDANYQPKPAVAAMLAVLNNSPIVPRGSGPSALP